MASLICGSLAFDTIMNFDGQFSDQILPDQLHNLSVSFLVPTLERDYGGCAGNIAYALNLLGGRALPMATLGRDGEDYLKRFEALGIDTRFVRQLPQTYTAQAMIMTDMKGNQITAFHPGAMMQAHITQVPQDADVRLGIVAPDGRQAMLEHAEQFQAAGIPFVFDPGQGLPMFDGDELGHFVDLADWVCVNDYEGQMLSARMGLDLPAISQKLQGLVVTLGAEGCDVWQNGEKTRVAGVQADQVLDPTGCGDAWRGAFLYGLGKAWPLTQCALLGNHLGALKVASKGPQNYQLSPQVQALLE